jgi:hypothetical protein
MQVTFEDKDHNNKDGLHNKFRDIDANELKNAVNSKLDAPIIVGQRPIILCVAFDASAGLFPTTGGTGVGGAVQKGNVFPITGTGNLAGESIPAIFSAMALTDAPGQDVTKWKLNF